MATNCDAKALLGCGAKRPVAACAGTRNRLSLFSSLSTKVDSRRLRHTPQQSLSAGFQSHAPFLLCPYNFRTARRRADRALGLAATSAAPGSTGFRVKSSARAGGGIP